MKKIYGLVGTPQSAKTKINSIFPEFGIDFVNLNSAGNKMRALGSPTRPLFDELVPGQLFDDGVRRPAYYLEVCRRPEILQKIMAIEIPIIQRYADEQIASATGPTILSWEYLQLLSPEIIFDQVILLICQDKDVWFKRLRFRADERGFNKAISDNQLEEIAKVHGFYDIIDGAIERWPNCLIVDTSPDDFGAENLRLTLPKLIEK